MIFNELKTKVLYAHYRKSDNQIFYVGYGTPLRPYDKHGRNVFWVRTVNKHDYYVEILQENLIKDRAEQLEILTIAFYGRRDLGKGTLVNLTDGGEGTSMVGKDNPSYDHTIFKFKKGDIIEKCTKHELCEKYPYLHSTAVKSITKGKNKTARGWFCLNPLKEFISKPHKSGYKLSKEHIKDISGLNNGSVDKTLYTFLHESGIKETCYRFELRDKYMLSKKGIYSIIMGKYKHHKGWQCLNPKKQHIEKQNSGVDKTLYTFLHESGIKETCTQFTLKEKYNLSSKISKLIYGERKTHKGWQCLTQKKKEVI